MTRAARIEGRVQIGIMLVMGGVAAAASFKHIHDLAVHYGQPSPVGWANAIVVELMSIVAGLEIRRRKRTGQSAGFVYGVFCCAVLISLAAQVAKADPSVWGWIMAALPALGFLAVVKIVLTRQPVSTEPDRTETTVAGPVHAPDRSRDLSSSQRPADGLACAPQSGPDRTSSTHAADAFMASAAPDEAGMQVPPRRTDGRVANSSSDQIQHDGTVGGSDRTSSASLDRSADGPLPQSSPLHDKATPDAARGPVEHQGRQSGPQDTPPRQTGDRSVDIRSIRSVSQPARRSGPDPELLQLGRTIAAKVAMRRGKLTRQVLIDEIRGTGGTISTDRASDLLQLLKESEKAPALPA